MRRWTAWVAAALAVVAVCSVPAPASATTTPLLGADVGLAGPGLLDFPQMASSGYSFALVTGTYLDAFNQWAQTSNPYLRQNMDAARAAGLVVGASVDARPYHDAISQADAFAAAVGHLSDGDLPPVVVLRDSAGLDAAQLTTWLQSFLDRLQADTGFVPMIKTTALNWQNYLASTTAFSRYALWESDISGSDPPPQIGGWATPTLWEYQLATVPGVGGTYASQFDGSLAQLRGVAQSPGRDAVNAVAAANPYTAPFVSTAAEPTRCGLVNGGCRQIVESIRSVYWSPPTGAHAVVGGIDLRFANVGAESGIGYPVTDMICGLAAGGCAQHFQGGSIYWSPATDAWDVRGGILIKWAALGWPSFLGYPTSGQICGLTNGGCENYFQNGRILWSPATEAHFVRGAILQTFWSQNEERGIGYPVLDEVCYLRNGGCAQHFTNGSIYWSPATRAIALYGGIRAAYAGQGWESGFLGYPTTDQICGLARGGCYQWFQGGVIYWSPATGAWPVPLPVWSAYGRAGAENGRYGYPAGPAYRSGAYWVQPFQGGAIRVRG